MNTELSQCRIVINENEFSLFERSGKAREPVSLILESEILGKRSLLAYVTAVDHRPMNFPSTTVVLTIAIEWSLE